MNSQQRVLSALCNKIPDKVPYMYSYIDRSIQEHILGRRIEYEYMPRTADWSPISKPGEQSVLEPYQCIDAEVARILGLDAIGMQYMTPVFAEVDRSEDGNVFIRKNLLISPEDLEKIKTPDVDDERIFKPAIEFVKRYKGEFALYCRIRLGISPTLMSMGMEEFAYNMYDRPEFVIEVVKMFTGWVSKLIKNLIEIGFDFLWAFDDMAHTTAPLFSEAVWDKYFFPYLKKATDCIVVPWIFHSDGNLLPFMDKILDLEMNGLHPLEPGAMDVVELKQKYGHRVCLVGNIDINHTLSKGTLEEVDAEVKNRMDILGPGGGFIISDSNSIPAYCKVENVLAMARAVEKYRYIY
jgi:uroporphyrinogen decarboxylase